VENPRRKGSIPANRSRSVSCGSTIGIRIFGKSLFTDSLETKGFSRVIRAERCGKHLKAAFLGRKLVDITADAIEEFLGKRLTQHVRVRAGDGYREKGLLKSMTVHQEFRALRRMLNVAVRKKLLIANPCSGVEFPVAVKGLFRPRYLYWSEQEKFGFHGPEYLRNVVEIITETGLRVYKELTPMKKEQV
jgi:Phage integrase SAM-like domain